MLLRKMVRKASRQECIAALGTLDPDDPDDDNSIKMLKARIRRLAIKTKQKRGAKEIVSATKFSLKNPDRKRPHRRKKEEDFDDSREQLAGQPDV
jgi:hypothetical protein